MGMEMDEALDGKGYCLFLTEGRGITRMHQRSRDIWEQRLDGVGEFAELGVVEGWEVGWKVCAV
jgi:hypothetical protein